VADITLPAGSKALINLKDGPRGNAGTATREFYNFLRQLASLTGSEALQAEIDAILVRLLELEAAESFLINGPASVLVSGQPSSGIVTLTLVGDSTVIDPDTYYGTDSVGERGFYPFPVTDSAVPYLIPLGETFTVSLYKQALFTLPIDVQGTLVVDGFLVEVA